MQTRRQFLLNAIVGGASLSGFAAAFATTPSLFKGEDVFERIVHGSNVGNWSTLPIGELMGKIGKALEGTPYKANTLELAADQENCSVDLTALDCVTYFETTLAFARILKKRKTTPADLLAEVAFIRYRNGKPGDYTTRLHYMTDWFADNEKKHVVEMLAPLPGSKPFTKAVGLMSSHPESSIQLKAHPNLIETIKQQEAAINKRSIKFVPIEMIEAVEPLLKTGDIVAICTSIPGLDVAHTGLIFCTADGVRHFMDATSRRGQMIVKVESEPLTQALGRSKSAIGAIFARPLEP